MDDNTFWKLLAAIFLTYLTGTLVNIMDIDASQYAAMSQEMLQSGSYLQVFEHGNDYLDKPPLVFWLSSLSMSVFGATNFAYKLPSLLFAILAVYSTYRFALVFYSKTIAQMAALVLASLQALFMITNDCRTDTLLMGCVAFALWHLAVAFQSNNWRHFLLGFIGIGFGLLAKGPVALIIPALAFSVHFIVKKEYKNFIRFEYLWGLVVIALILLPMCIGLYQQFDLHPEKIVNGKTGVSGLRFFFWTQSFGRITGENPWHNAVYFTYLLQTMLWSFAPWILFFLIGIVVFIVNGVKKEPNFESPEWITIGGCILGYASLASSKYQLPHYIFVIYPLAAVVTARFIVEVLEGKKEWISSKILRGVQWFLISALWALPFLILVYVFPDYIFRNIVLGIMLLFSSVYAVFAVLNKQIIVSSVYTVIVINLFLNLYFYRQLLPYQEGSEVGKAISKMGIPNDKFFTYQYENFSSLHFYSRRIVVRKDSASQVKVGDWLLTNETGLADLQNAELNVKMVETGNTYSVTNLTLEFLNHKTRSNVVGQYFLVQIIEPEIITEPEPIIEPDEVK